MSKRRQPINPDEWVMHLRKMRGEQRLESIEKAIAHYSAEKSTLLEKGMTIADILLLLGLDNDTLAAAIMYPLMQSGEIVADNLVDEMGESSVKLLTELMQMQSLNRLQQLDKRSHHQLENLRKMLLAMVTDVRVVLVILAERLWQLREAKQYSEEQQQSLANETLTVFAPLANRLGVWHLKWEIEDLCLRYLHPDIYKQIAKGIAAKRDEREAYIKQFIDTLNEALLQAGIKHFQITGRVKHIYSIYKKMQRKNANLEQIYDMSALRVMTDTIDECYAVLGVLQNHWDQVPEEFDDYISQPKPNGYRSIHTVLIGPGNHFVEVQIRTFQMHQESELGVAAHWRYKEGVLQTSNYEAKIALLRQIIEWQKEVVNTESLRTEQSVSDLFADRIYVFTPTGDIIDLPAGATPLDFAYTIHSEVGHRCRGAKVDGNMVPLTTVLQMGQRVEILTAKYANPSRDWMNPQLGYLKSPRSRAKVQHWFRVKDSEAHALSGREILEKELRKVGINIAKVSLDQIAPKLHYRSSDDLLAAVTTGECRIAQIIQLLAPPPKPVETNFAVENRADSLVTPNINILGIEKLLTHTARCCKPLPGDAVIGYITRNRGVTIHRRDCTNLTHIGELGEDRLIEVAWGNQFTTAYPADLLIMAFDRAGLLRDITTLLVSEKVEILGLQTQKKADQAEVEVYLTIQVSNRQQLTTVVELLRQIPNITAVKRR